VLDGGPDPSMGRGNFEGNKGRPSVKYTVTEVCKNSWTDLDAVWVMGSGGFKKPYIRRALDPLCERAIFRGQDMSGHARRHSAVQKRLNRSRCHLSCGVGWAEGRMCYIGAHWPNLANTTEPSVCGGDATLCQISLTTCYTTTLHYLWNINVQKIVMLKSWVKQAAMQDSPSQDSCWKNSCTVMLALFT